MSSAAYPHNLLTRLERHSNVAVVGRPGRRRFSHEAV